MRDWRVLMDSRIGELDGWDWVVNKKIKKKKWGKALKRRTWAWVRRPGTCQHYDMWLWGPPIMDLSTCCHGWPVPPSTHMGPTKLLPVLFLFFSYLHLPVFLRLFLFIFILFYFNARMPEKHRPALQSCIFQIGDLFRKTKTDPNRRMSEESLLEIFIMGKLQYSH